MRSPARCCTKHVFMRAACPQRVAARPHLDFFGVTEVKWQLRAVKVRLLVLLGSAHQLRGRGRGHGSPAGRRRRGLRLLFRVK